MNVISYCLCVFGSKIICFIHPLALDYVPFRKHEALLLLRLCPFKVKYRMQEGGSVKAHGSLCRSHWFRWFPADVQNCLLTASDSFVCPIVCCNCNTSALTLSDYGAHPPLRGRGRGITQGGHTEAKAHMDGESGITSFGLVRLFLGCGRRLGAHSAAVPHVTTGGQ